MHYRNFILVSLLYTMLVLTPHITYASLEAENSFTITMPATVEEQKTYALELRYTYTSPAEALPILAASARNDLQAYPIPNVFSLHITTNSKNYSYTVVMQNGTHSLYIYPLMLEGDILSLTIEVPQALREIFGSVQKAIRVHVYGRTLKDLQHLWKGALPLSIEDMLAWKGSAYTSIGEGDGDIFRWNAHPFAIVLVFRSNAIQAKYLKRLAFFVEKQGTRGTLLSDTQLQTRKGWGAHDYKADDLARFFEQARLQGMSLNEEEYRLKKHLLDVGVLKHKVPHTKDIAHSAVQEGLGTVSTISRSYSSALQKTLLTHELLHAWFFTDARLRDTVDTVWTQSSAALKQAWRRFLASKGYDPEFEYLVQNEFFAYVLQNPKNIVLYSVNSWFTFLGVQARRAFQREITQAVETLETYVRNVYNVQAGFLQYKF